MDIKIIDNEAYLFAKTGNEKTAYSTDILASNWLVKVQELGAGEVVINAMGQDGIQQGYDIDLLKTLEKFCSIPMIASGGAGGPQAGRAPGAAAAECDHAAALVTAPLRALAEADCRVQADVWHRV